MALRRSAKIPLLLLAAVYVGLGALVSLRQAWWSPPERAAEAYLEAIAERDTPGIYLYSDMLGAHLAGMMTRADMPEDARRHLWAKDFARWQEEFRKGSRAQDSLKRERRLIPGQVRIQRVAADGYQAEVFDGQESSLVSYQDVPGRTHHVYFRLDYPAPQAAPTVGILDNVRTGRQRRIRSVVVRVEVAMRPEVAAPRRWLLGWDWLDRIAWAFPFRLLFGPGRPEESWMAGVRFAVDKLSLETF